jgi:hypothetical protein
VSLLFAAVTHSVFYRLSNAFFRSEHSSVRD